VAHKPSEQGGSLSDLSSTLIVQAEVNMEPGKKRKKKRMRRNRPTITSGAKRKVVQTWLNKLKQSQDEITMMRSPRPPRCQISRATGTTAPPINSHILPSPTTAMGSSSSSARHRIGRGLVQLLLPRPSSARLIRRRRRHSDIAASLLVQTADFSIGMVTFDPTWLALPLKNTY
jgi:hypothetical protein